MRTAATGDRGARLDELLRARPDEVHRLDDLRLGDGDDRLDVLGEHGERAGRQAGEQPVGDRRGRVRRDDRRPAASDRAASSAASGLGADDAGRRVDAVGGERGAREQAAAADRRDHRVEAGDLARRARAPRLPAPAITWSLSNGWISTAPVSAITRGDGRRARLERRLAQHDPRAVRLDRGRASPRVAVDGTTMCAGMPRGARRERQRGAVVARRVRRDATRGLLGASTTAPRWSRPGT